MDEVLLRAPERTRFPTVNVVLFAMTAMTTLVCGYVLTEASGNAGPASGGWVWQVIVSGLPFAASLLGILFAHEMGHYTLARHYRVDTTLPFFIPVPFGVGTLGAVIRMRSRMPSRRAVLDIGAAGPIAGFVIAVPLLLWGYAHSPEIAGVDPGVQSAVSMVRDLVRGDHAAASGGGAVFGRSLVTWAALHLTHPGLAPGADVAEHPVAIAAWFGLLVTALNLIPIGQLDGGHVVYALLGRERARRVSQVASWGLLVLGLFVSWHWIPWWLLTRFLVGTGHPPSTLEEPLTPGRRALALGTLLLLALTFMPMPVRSF